MNLQIAKWGNSLAVRLPVDAVRRLGLREGDSIDAQVTADGGLTLRSASWSRRAFAAELEAARSLLPMGTDVTEAMRQEARY